MNFHYPPLQANQAISMPPPVSSCGIKIFVCICMGSSFIIVQFYAYNNTFAKRIG